MEIYEQVAEVMYLIANLKYILCVSDATKNSIMYLLKFPTCNRKNLLRITDTKDRIYFLE